MQVKHVEWFICALWLPLLRRTLQHLNLGAFATAEDEPSVTRGARRERGNQILMKLTRNHDLRVGGNVENLLLFDFVAGNSADEP